MDRKIDTIIEAHPDAEYLQADGFDGAILGTSYNADPPVLVYSISKILEILRQEGLSYEEAREYFDYNIGGGYVGEQTPIWVEDEEFYDAI